MRAGPIPVALLLFAPPVLAGPGPMAGTEDIPKLMAESTLVCKGEVTQAPEPIFVSADPIPRQTATAMVQVDRCFKGEQPTSGMVPVLFDQVLPSAGAPAGWPAVIFRKGDYRLYFLKSNADKYVLADKWFGQLKVSRQLAADAGRTADPMSELEMDLKAGLTDSDRDRVLDSIRMLGNMRRLHSTSELYGLLDSDDDLVRTYVYQALLRLQHYSALRATENWLMSQSEPPANLLLPRDALFQMEFQLASEISRIRDPRHLGIMAHLLELPSPIMRREIAGGIRAMGSMQSAPILLKLLDDRDADIAFNGMQGLIELAGGGAIDWVPTYEQFRNNQAYYAANCRQWWEEKHPVE